MIREGLAGRAAALKPCDARGLRHLLGGELVFGAGAPSDVRRRGRERSGRRPPRARCCRRAGHRGHGDMRCDPMALIQPAHHLVRAVGGVGDHRLHFPSCCDPSGRAERGSRTEEVPPRFDRNFSETEEERVNNDRENELEQALDFISEMVATRSDGDAYICIFERLEAELHTLRARNDTKERARRRLRESQFRLAA